MEKTNIALLTDAYKQTHWMQYPPGTQYVYSYFESRGGRFDSTVFYGLQILLKKYLEGVVIDEAMVNEADEFCKKVFGQDYFNREGWMHIVKEHGGRLPIRNKAVPEGTVVPNRNVIMTIENTDPKVPFASWLGQQGQRPHVRRAPAPGNRPQHTGAHPTLPARSQAT
jgi:nicotinamide phosphoribosyltransferase